MSMKKATLYARVSSDLQQKERTIESQIAELRKQIEKAGDVLVKEYIDDGYSGALLDRPAMNQLRGDLKKDLFDTIYILNTDRIARDVTYQNIIIGEMLRYRKQIIINGKDYIHNPENKFTLTVLGAVSELERAKLIERVMRGRQHRLNNGIMLGNGHQTYGYTYVRKTPQRPPSFEVNEQEAQVVQYIFEAYAKGDVGIRTIGQQLANMGVPRQKGRNRLNQSQLKYILGNIMYTGVRYYNMMTCRDPIGAQQKKHIRRMMRKRSDWIGVEVPAIVSKDLYDKVQARLEFNRACYRNTKQPHPLSGLVWCSKCGSRCFAYRRTYYVKLVQQVRTYRRASYKCRSDSCRNPEINTVILESCVLDMFRTIVTNPEKLYGCVDLLKRKRRANRDKAKKRLKVIEERIRATEEQKRRITDLYASDELAREEYIRRVREYEKEFETLQSRRKEMVRYAPLFANPTLIRKDVEEYSLTVEKCLKHHSDSLTARQFLLNFVTRVEYQRKDLKSTVVKLRGSIPVEKVPVEFTVVHTMDWHEVMARRPKQPSEEDRYYRAPPHIV